MRQKQKMLILLLLIGFSTKVFSQVDNLVIGKLNLEPGTVLKLDALHGRAQASWKGFPKCVPQSDSKSLFYTLPDGFLILETKWNELSNNNGSFAVSTLAKDTKILTREEIKEVQDDLINYDFNISDKEKSSKIKAYIENKTNEYLLRINDISTNQNTIKLDLYAKAHGGCTDQKRGWIEGKVSATVIYLGSDKQALKEKLISDVNNFKQFLN